jgi:hypothetical protein
MMYPLDSEGASAPSGAIVRAFGEENRERLLDRYFTQVAEVAPDEAWRHVYRLLLWTDPTTGLAHCYESDKCQPGRPWYARSLAFHWWISGALGARPSELGGKIDLLFRWATEDLAIAAARRRAAYAAAAEQQREPYAEQAMPLPGENPELVEIVTETLTEWLVGEPPSAVMRMLTERVRAHVGQENKRKNLLGEGFEDTIAAVLRRLPGVRESHDVVVRPWLHDIPGFHRPRGGDKPRQVDLTLVRRRDAYRTLVSCKWSVRSDREEQFASDFEAYARLESAGEAFDYVLLTNEFDPARLAAACENRRGRDLLFTDVVHVNLDGPRAAYGAPIVARGRGIERTLGHIDSGRLESMGTWLQAVAEHGL